MDGEHAGCDLMNVELARNSRRQGRKSPAIDGKIESVIRARLESGGKAVAPFLTAGFPDRPTFVRLLGAMQEVGSDIIEVGLPFSDPLADGGSVQFASQQSLSNGGNVTRALEDIAAAAIAVPVVAMSYINPILAQGVSWFAREARAAGVCGVIVPDAPLDRMNRAAVDLEPLSTHMERVLLAAPTSSDFRLRAIGKATRGFLYAVTVTGVTGVREGIPAAALEFLRCARSATRRPVLAGFGIGDAGTARRVAEHCDGVIIGSAIIEAIRDGNRKGAIRRAVRLVKSIRNALGPD